MLRTRTLTAAIVIAGFAAAPAFAGIINASMDDAETYEENDGSGLVGDVTAVTGFAGNRSTSLSGGNEGTAFIIPFQLPDFGNVDGPFLSASFSISLIDENLGTSKNAYLVGLADARSSSTVLASDFAEPTDSGDTIIQDNFATPTTALGILDTDAAAGAILASYLNELYNASTLSGGTGGTWVFLRLTTSGSYSHSQRYTFASANNTDEGVQAPVITYSLVPEPASLALLGLGGLMLAARRRA